MSYTSTGGYLGPDSISYTISDGHGGTATATIGVTVVQGPNQNPVTVSHSITNVAGAPTWIDPRSTTPHDTDPDGDALSLVSVQQPAHGVTGINGTNSAIYYAGTLGYSGSDSFTYQITDGRGGYATGTVSVTIALPNNPPVAATDIRGVAPSTAITFDPRGNDVDPDGNPITITAVTVPAQGGTATSVEAGHPSPIRRPARWRARILSPTRFRIRMAERARRRTASMSERTHRQLRSMTTWTWCWNTRPTGRARKST